MQSDRGSVTQPPSPGHHCFRARASTTTNPPPFRRRLAAFLLLLLLVSFHRPSWNLGLGSCFGAIHRLSWADPWVIKFVHCQCPFLPYRSTSDIGAKAREEAADGLPAAGSPDQQRPGARRAAFRGSFRDSYKQTSVRPDRAVVGPWWLLHDTPFITKLVWWVSTILFVLKH